MRRCQKVYEVCIAEEAREGASAMLNGFWRSGLRRFNQPTL